VKVLGKLVRVLDAFTRELTRPRIVDSASDPQIGLALGGGFARGLAHIGVIRVLQQENIPISFVAGTSVGAVVGAGICCGLSADELEAVALRVRFKHFARWTISRFGFASNDRMTGFLRRTLKWMTFEELHIPLAVTATDFVTGDAVVFRSGDVIDPVRASCAYPGMFLPVNIKGRLLVDGMLSNAVPTLPLREMGARRVIAVHLNGDGMNLNGPRHIFDVIGQCFSIAQQRMSSVWRSEADVVINPDVRGFSYDSFDRCVELIAAGETAARLAMPAIRAWLNDTPAVTLGPKPTVTATAQPASAPATGM